jgi:hypothetical protein
MALANPVQPVQKRFAILLSKENPLPAVATRHDVVNRSRILKSRWTSHAQCKPGIAQPSTQILNSKDPVH